jgi:hypothetical protein
VITADYVIARTPAHGERQLAMRAGILERYRLAALLAISDDVLAENREWCETSLHRAVARPREHFLN